MRIIAPLLTKERVADRLEEMNKTGILLFLLTPRWPASYSLFLLFSLLRVTQK